MSYTPAKLGALRDLWKSKGGSFLGVVGSTTTHRQGYHLGRDRIFSACAAKPDGVHCVAGLYSNDYSVRDVPARDGGAHCTNAAMAIDLGPLAGKPGSEVTLAKWLITQCHAGAADTKDIRAINYQRMRYDRIRGQASAAYQHDVDETGHVHIEFHRDSEARDKTSAVRRWLATLPSSRTVKCSGGFAWAGASSTSTRKGPVAAGDVCVARPAIGGGAWSFDCNGTAKKGTLWYPVTAINGRAVKTLFGVDVVYVATGRF